MRFSLSLFACLLFSVLAIGQPNDILLQHFTVQSQSGFLSSMPTYLNTLTSRAVVTETLLLHPDWKPCGILSLDDNLLEGEARYNVMLDQVQLKNENGMRAIYSNMVKAVVIDHDLFLPAYFVPEDPREDPVLGWGQMEIGGELQVIRRYEPVKRKTDYQIGKLQASTDMETVVGSSWYVLSRGDKMAYPLKMGKRRLLQLMEDEADQVAAYARQNRLSFLKVEDVKMLFRYYNRVKKEQSQRM
jgi:hypothetical protein